MTLRMAYGLEQGRAKGLCPKNVASLYDNLSDVYSIHNNLDSHKWNIDEFGAQVGWNREGHN